MKIKNHVFRGNEQFEYISRLEPNAYCVFIIPGGIVSPEEVIKELNLDCDYTDLWTENIILETYDDANEADNRVMEFRGKWLTYFYTCMYANGNFLCENT